MLVLVVYDIPDNKRRTKLATFLEGYGRRVQKSVFECFLTRQEMQALHCAVEQRIDVTEDNVRFYWIPADALSRALTLGSSPPEPPPDFYII
ncbi:CRISPR-associated endonuclease Cas2 [[Limnothrix rosea] IAM M-220]|uniref:CRISPR-associated endonuclease Cas2 n=1 Tax=[Limnothrix rosea] IAM M-220 TaxID=454133 RepID=UPI00095B4BEE|nr:CRISPR-associated endonuclease Cas2 [[Limnothrix rosea] IAM M-220]OKH18649.1 CRISPR-associated endonuclease Cas2 [[Limnothrix rosea] IAM M-220]